MEASANARWFWIATCIGVAPQLLAIYTFSQGASAFVLLVLAWNVSPFVVSAIFFLAGAHAVAWGWLIAVALWGAWEAVSVVTSHSSTASLGFLWGPVWSFTVLGPIGAVIALADKQADAKR